MNMRRSDSTSPPARPGREPLSSAPQWAQGVSLDVFTLAYEDWKAATVRFEEAVRAMHEGEPGAREQAQDCARELARLHHEFLEASQPHFATSGEGDGDSTSDSDPASVSLRSGSAMAPGDEAPPGTPGTGDATCPRCAGSGRVDGAQCGNCLGAGRIVAGVGGA